jgi:hypothetical protein
MQASRIPSAHRLLEKVLVAALAAVGLISALAGCT